MGKGINVENMDEPGAETRNENPPADKPKSSKAGSSSSGESESDVSKV